MLAEGISIYLLITIDIHSRLQSGVISGGVVFWGQKTVLSEHIQYLEESQSEDQ